MVGYNFEYAVFRYYKIWEIIIYYYLYLQNHEINKNKINKSKTEKTN